MPGDDRHFVNLVWFRIFKCEKSSGSHRESERDERICPMLSSFPIHCLNRNGVSRTASSQPREFCLTKLRNFNDVLLFYLRIFKKISYETKFNFRKKVLTWNQSCNHFYLDFFALSNLKISIIHDLTKIEWIYSHFTIHFCNYCWKKIKAITVKI